VTSPIKKKAEDLESSSIVKSSPREKIDFQEHLPQITVNNKQRASPSPPPSSDVSKDLDTSLSNRKISKKRSQRKKKKWKAPVPIDLPSESYFIKNGIGRVYSQRN
jgi:hypothetical protein